MELKKFHAIKTKMLIRIINFTAILFSLFHPLNPEDKPYRRICPKGKLKSYSVQIPSLAYEQQVIDQYKSHL